MEMFIFGSMTESEAPLNRQDIESIMVKGRDYFAELQCAGIDDIIRLLSEVGKSWQDPEYPYRREALKILPQLIGFSPGMIEEGIETMVGLLDEDNLKTRLECDLGNRRYLDGWEFFDPFNGHLRAQPLGIITHVSAGNVFVGAVDTLIQGIVTKNVNIMKMSSADPVFPVLFAKSLQEHDKHSLLKGSVALLHWKGGTPEIEDLLKERSDAVIVYGGEETVRSYRNGLGLHTRLVEYGPKYSFILVDSEAAEKNPAAIELMGRDIIMWEQSACSSPHVIYYEDRGRSIVEFADLLAGELERWNRKIPQGKVYEDEAVEITRVREMAKVEEAMGKSKLIVPDRGIGWTVVIQFDSNFSISCHNRTIFIKPVARLEDVPEIVSGIGKHIQTVSIVADPERAFGLGKQLVQIGADRIVGPGKMAVRKHGTPHDGTRGLAEFVRWASCSIPSSSRNEGPKGVDCSWKQYDPLLDRFDYLTDHDRLVQVTRWMKSVIEYAAEHSPLFSERFSGKSFRSIADLKDFPLLTGEDMKNYLPPAGEGILTDDSTTGYVFSSGGTTGKPKVVYRTHEEQHYNAVRLGKGLALSVFGKTDTVANLLFAGNMWASFVSYNMALEHTGCRILPIGGNLDMKDIVEYLRLFKADSAISIPSVLLSLAAYVESNSIQDLRITKVSTGGEHLFAGARQYLNKVLGVEQFASTGYTTNDTGAIGYQCEACEGGVHHVHEDLHYVEILHPDTNLPVAGNEIGKIVVTNLQRRLMPTIRYEVGDQGRWISGPCRCGRKTRLMELLGRSDEVLIIGGGNIHPEVVAKAVHETRGIGEKFQMAAVLDGHLDQLCVRVERSDDSGESDESIRQELKNRLLVDSKELRTMYEKGLIAEVSVQVLPTGGIPVNPRTGKIKLTVDERR